MSRLFSLVIVATLSLSYSTPVLSYKPGRPKLVPLNKTLIRQVIACYPGVERAEQQAMGGPSQFYKNRARLRDGALRRCGFPYEVVWRNAAYSVRIAAEEVTYASHSDELRAANRLLAIPLKDQLARIFRD